MRHITASTETQSAPASIAQSITFGILSGHYRPGTRLPTLQELAEIYHVNPSTMQRAVARLEAQGLITARQGSGLRVNDPLTTGNFSLLPAWIHILLERDPEAALAMMDNTLTALRLPTAHLLVVLPPTAVGELRQMVRPLVAVGDAPSDLVLGVHDALARALTADGRQTCFQLLFNSLSETISAVPLLRDAIFADVPAYVALCDRVFDEVERSSDLAVHLGVLEEYDNLVMERVARELGIPSLSPLDAPSAVVA